MQIKLFDSELKVMEALWSKGDLTAVELVGILNQQTGWNKNTTYTVIKKLIEKGAIERMEPNFTCKARIGKEEVQQQEATELIGKLFNGSADAFLAAFLSDKTLSKEEIHRLKQLIEQLSA